jgi:hypothetical protein
MEREQAASSHTSLYEPDEGIKWGAIAHIAPCSPKGELLPNDCLSIDCTCHPVRDAQGSVLHNHSNRKNPRSRF